VNHFLGSTIQIEFRKGLIRLPINPETPLICIGPGTGVAPMRSVIEDRLHGGSHCKLFSLFSLSWLIIYLLLANFLYFGCRSASKDQHYASEWRSYSENQQMHYRAAFSRDGPEGEKRTYVQDLIHQDSKQIWNLVGEQKSWVLISG
jgi:sulfite reductase alpha subunit-like flavoprotein